MPELEVSRWAGGRSAERVAGRRTRARVRPCGGAAGRAGRGLAAQRASTGLRSVSCPDAPVAAPWGVPRTAGPAPGVPASQVPEGASQGRGAVVTPLRPVPPRRPLGSDRHPAGRALHASRADGSAGVAVPAVPVGPPVLRAVRPAGRACVARPRLRPVSRRAAGRGERVLVGVATALASATAVVVLGLLGDSAHGWNTAAAHDVPGAPAASVLDGR
ncbi:hypothetical protein [Pseudonocardia phyllosphaerae]|uniref:hypothetical protein n=1 Tax=Pseudonocardia phyllosphaerae TaxID=3390502 RepID=UPI00397A8FE5